MDGTYTLTLWQVKPGMEEEFVRCWDEWVDWSHRQGFTARAELLRDHERPGAFVSFGPWESVEAVRNWRSLEGYQERVVRMHQLVESFEPRTLSLVERR